MGVGLTKLISQEHARVAALHTPREPGALEIDRQTQEANSNIGTLAQL